MARVKFKMPPTKRIMIEDGVAFECLNPSWDRPFDVERTEVGSRVYYLCRFTAPDPTRTDDHYDFDRFVAVLDKPTGIVEVQNHGQMKGHAPKPHDIVAEGNFMLERYRCPGCGKTERFKTRNRTLGPELVKVTYIWPCGYTDVDMID